MVGEDIIPDAPNHSDQGACGEPARRAGLIGALASRNHLESMAENRLARGREASRSDNEVHVQTAKHYDRRFHLPKSIPSFFSSSA